MAGERVDIRIGVDRPEWLPEKYFLAARIGAGLFIGVALTAYGTALAVALENMVVGDGARAGQLFTLVLGGWVIKETLRRMTLRTVRPADEPEAKPVPRTGSVNV